MAKKLTSQEFQSSIRSNGIGFSRFLQLGVVLVR